MHAWLHGCTAQCIGRFISRCPACTQAQSICTVHWAVAAAGNAPPAPTLHSHGSTCTHAHSLTRLQRHRTTPQVATAIRGAIIQAKMSVIPIRRGYWGNKIGKVRAAWLL